jgi:hypothetical protein
LSKAAQLMLTNHSDLLTFANHNTSRVELSRNDSIETSEQKHIIEEAYSNVEQKAKTVLDNCFKISVYERIFYIDERSIIFQNQVFDLKLTHPMFWIDKIVLV